MLSDSNARLAAARRLTSRKGRREAGLFLAEGAQAVREALAAPGCVLDLFVTAQALEREAGLLAGHAYDEITDKAAAALSETVTPQGLVAVCRPPLTSVAELLAERPRLLALLVEPNDPGNLGTIIRTADAAGADAVVLDGGADPYNGKAVRASAGSLFHLPIVFAGTAEVFAGLPAIGMTSLATTGAGTSSLDDLVDDGTLAGPTTWIFGTEAHGLPEPVLESADRTVRLPIYGRAESLNLSAAAAVCLYASARAQRRD